MRRVFIIVAAMAAVFILFIGVVAMGDLDKYRPQLAQQLSQQLDARVELRGKISLSLFPFPRLAAQDAEFDGKGLYIRAPALRLSTEFWPLLSGRLLLSKVEIINPEIRLAPEAWISSDDIDAEHANIQLQNLTVKNGYLRLRLDQHPEIFSHLNLTLTAPDWRGPYHTKGDFIHHDRKWKFDSVMGVASGSGRRPLSMNLQRAGNDISVKWHGAFLPSPLTLLGDGIVQWENQPLVIWAGEMNLHGDHLEIARGVVAAGDAELGNVTGKYDLAEGKWDRLSASLHNLQPNFMAQIPQAEEWQSWLKGQRIQKLAFEFQDKAYQNFSLSTAMLQVTQERNDWLVKGQNAAALFAHMTGGDVRDWPPSLSTPFLMRAAPLPGGVKIKNLNFDQNNFSGSLADGKLSLSSDHLLWDDWIAAAIPWRGLMVQNGIKEINVKIGSLDMAPFAFGRGELSLTSAEGEDRLRWRVGGLEITGAWDGEKFAGKLGCAGSMKFWPLLNNSCVAATINGDAKSWHFTPAVSKNAAGVSGDVNFSQASWKLGANALGGQITGRGKLGDDDWHMDLEKLSLRKLLAVLLPGAPDGDGKVSGRLIVINNSARGEVTASDLNLSALNLSATDRMGTNFAIQNENLRKPGQILRLKADLNWQNNQMRFSSLQTESPVGYGKAKIDRDKKEWAGEWQGAGMRVAIDGPATDAFATAIEDGPATRRR